MCKKHVVIIGGGIGGLFTGAFLAKEGVTVTVVEKNATVGGGLQSFKRFGMTFDTGMHVIGGIHSTGNFYKICKYLGVLDKIKIKRVDEDCSDYVYVSSDNKGYKIATGKDGFVESLSVYFPHQRKELENYVNALFRLSEELDLFYLRRYQGGLNAHSDEFLLSADEFISKYISDEKLRGVLSFQNLLYAGERGVTPAYIHAIISVLYINGSARFVDGSAHFAELLADVIKNNGGEVITGERVEKAWVENKKISHCVTSKGRVITADTFISSIQPDGFLKLLDGEHAFSNAYRSRLDSIRDTYSALILNIKLKPNSVKYINYTGHYMNNYSDSWKSPREVKEWPNIVLYMTPPVEGQSEYASVMNLLVPMTWNEVEKWQNTGTGHRGEDYLAWKKSKAEHVIKCMEKVFPGLTDAIEQMDISTPLTIRDFYGTRKGALYGYAKDCRNLMTSRITIKTKLENLFFTGQNCNIHGLCGVSLTAIITSETIVGNNRILDKINASET